MDSTGAADRTRTPVGLRELIPGRSELRSMAKLSFPVASVQVGMMAMGVVDTLMVGRVSATALAAVALGHIYFFSVSVFGTGILMALDPLVSQAIGAGDREAVRRGVQRGLILAVGLAVMGGAALLPGELLLGLLSQPPDVVPVAAAYARAAIAGIFPYFAFVVLRQSLQAMGRVSPIVWTMVGANLANVFFNWVFIFGNIGAPPLGAVGAGWTSSVSRWLMALFLLGAAWPLLEPYLRTFDRDALAGGPLFRMIRIGVPIGAQFELEFGAFAVIAVFMGWLGTTAMAAHQIAINLASFTFMVPLGISQAAAVLVGRAVGRQDPAGARRAGGAGILLGSGFMVLAAVLFLVAPGLLARFYTADPAVYATATVLIPIAGVFQVFDGIQVVASGVLRGIGDTRAPLVVNILGFWLLGMPVSLLLGFAWEGGPVGLWWGLATGLAAVALFLTVRIRSRFGGELRRLSLEEDAGGGGPPIHRETPSTGGRRSAAGPSSGEPAGDQRSMRGSTDAGGAASRGGTSDG